MISVLVNELNVMGGTHKQVLRLCQYLSREKIDFEVVTKCYEAGKTYPGFEDFCIKSISRCEVRFAGRIGRYVRKLVDEYNVFRVVDKRSKFVSVHDNGFPLSMVLLKLANKKIFWQINDLPWVFLQGNSKVVKLGVVSGLYAGVARFVYKYLAKTCVDRITVNVSKNADRVRRLLSVDADVLHCGVDVWKGPTRDRLFEGRSIKILTSGVFFPFRNYETQVRVVERLVGMGYDVELDIIGSVDLDKPYYHKISSMIRGKDLNDRIRIQGQVSNEVYERLHFSADIFLFLNVDQSWGLAVFEAISAGLPAIVSNSVGAVELLEDGRDSIFVDPLDVDEIVSAVIGLKNIEKYNSVVKRGRILVENCSWDNMYSSRLVKLMNYEK